MLAAMGEFDRLGRDAFLARFGFGRARSYFVEVDGRQYDSKAIVGAAHGFVSGMNPLPAKDFSGGEDTVASHLRSLGFAVSSPSRALQPGSNVNGVDLIELVDHLRPAGRPERPVRHQALLLLWAIGRAGRGLPRLVRWTEAQNELRSLLDVFGLPESAATPEYPFVALAHTEWWELPDADGEVPSAHGSGVLRWLNAVNPLGGLTAAVYDRLTSSHNNLAEVTLALLDRFFAGEQPDDLLSAVQIDIPVVGTGSGAAVGTAVPDAKKRPPLWTWNELVLACALTADNDWHELDVNDPRVIELSALLQSLPIHAESVRGDGFRTAASVRRKMANLAHCHPNSTRRASNRGALDHEVVAAFVDRPDEMRSLAEQIRGQASGPGATIEQQNAPTTTQQPAGVVAGNVFAQFKPKSDTAYVAAIKAQVQTKNRHHERLVHEYGLAARALGFTPATNVHPRDLTLTRDRRHWLVEVKMIYRGNAVEAVRAVVGQLLQYRHFLYPPTGDVGLVAVFNEPIGDACVGFLEAQGISSVWRHLDTWHGSLSATRDGLVPVGDSRPAV
ncbi:hypothetical protein GCM10023319_08030 [Nocardia iowensis]